MGFLFFSMLSSWPGFRIRIIIALCRISGNCPVEIEDVSGIVDGTRARFFWRRVLILSGLMAVDDLANRIAFFSAGAKDGVPVNGS